MSRFLYSILGEIEFRRVWPIDFFPIRPTQKEIMKWDSICIGTKTRTIGDAMMLSALPRKLKQHYPHLKIYSYCRGYSPVVFQNNPYVDDISYFPRAVFGDDACWGEGHILEVKDEFFHLPKEKGPAQPELYLSDEEIQQGDEQMRIDDRPVCLLHPRGRTWGTVTSLSFWNEVVSQWKDQVAFIQLGMKGHEEIQGVDSFFMGKKGYESARTLFSMMKHADLFLGLNSGPMHAAAAFEVPSLIFTAQGEIEEIFEKRLEAPYFLHQNWANGFLYSQNQHVPVDQVSQNSAHEKVDRFMREVLGHRQT